MALDTIIKDPDAVLPYSINWASTDGTNDGTSADAGWLQGDTIGTSTWSITGPDALLVEDSESDSGTVATIVLSAGTGNRDYTVTNHIVTAAGYEEDRSLIVKVRER